MIWITGEALADNGVTPLVKHVQSVINDHCADMADLEESSIRELASAVATYISSSGESGMYVEAGYLVMLTSRALQSVGHQEAAHRLLVFGNGLVQPSEWTFCGGQSIWTLDLGQMVLLQETKLELVFFRSLNIVLDCVAEVWDRTLGQGRLGLRRTETVVSGILHSARGKRVDAFRQEIIDACQAKLKQIGSHRRWRYIPELLMVDRQ